MEPQPTLTTDRLVLRALAPADAPAIQRLAGDRDVAATTLRIPHPYADGYATEWINRTTEKFRAGTGVTFAITIRGAGEFIGAAGLMLTLEHERAELGYWIGKPFWNRGYATEAARAVVAYGFEHRGLHRIHACYFAENPQSGRVLEKSGMRPEGVLRRHVKKWDVFHDLQYCAVLRDEFTHGPAG